MACDISLLGASMLMVICKASYTEITAPTISKSLSTLLDDGLGILDQPEDGSGT